ncbi:M3 family metallopeptidase [Pendulispora albinea]|uniref:M3 family metallopeptidase n=1 Tax=Pendulispora albinea TaxID=2741071 RepID=A0ABZ2M3U4_9BACT
MRNAFFLGAGAVALVSASCAPAAQDAKGPAHSASAAAPGGSSPSAPPPAPNGNNPLLAKWAGPYGGVPPFAKVKVEQFKPALEGAMDLERREIAAIVDNPAAPTFANTIAALEDAGRTFHDVTVIYDIWSSNMNSPEFQAIEREMASKLAAFSDEINQNEKLFKRIEAVYNSPEKAKLTPEQQRLVWRHYTTLVRAGAKLDATAKARASEINQRLATLFTTFSQNVLADEENEALILDKESDLAGLPDSVRSGAAAAAAARGAKGKWAVTNTRSSVEPFLTYSTRDDLREKVWKTFVNRGDGGGAHDNNKIIAEILKLRAERAKLLGYPTHAHWRLDDTMAKTPERATALMEAVWKPAVARVREEVADMLAVANKENKKDKKPAKQKIAPWDYRYYAEKVRKAKYDLDANEVKPYLQLEKLREGMFWVAGELLNFSFTPVSGVEVFHPDVRVWEVKNKQTGKHVGLWYFDPYARPGKRSGAWMNDYRRQERFKGEITTIVSNNSNFVKPKEGEPVLISWDDAKTLFHEFGHALHGLSSDVTYPTVSGTNVARDYVEFPSQLLEHWVETPEVLNRFALHYKTGQPIPQELLAKIQKASTFNTGFAAVEYLSSALIDMKLHLAGSKDIDPDAFERDTLKSLGMPDEIVMRHRTPQFSHIFASDDYSAGYYSYLWSDTLTADAYEAFTEAKGPYDAAVAERLRKNVFATGDTIDPAEAYRAFRGKDAGIGPLMRKRGFADSGAKKTAK